jgi:hypothetical protein
VKRKDWKREAEGLAAALHLAETHVDELRRARDEAIVERVEWRRRHSELSDEHYEQRDRRAVERRSLRRLVAAMEATALDEADLDVELARAVEQARAALRLDPELYEAELDDPCRWLRAGQAILDAQAADPGDGPSAGELGDVIAAAGGSFVSGAVEGSVRRWVEAEQARLREVAQAIADERPLTEAEAQDAVLKAMRGPAPFVLTRRPGYESDAPAVAPWPPEPDDDDERVARITAQTEALPIGTPISITLPDWSRAQTFQVASAGRHGDAVWYGLVLPTLPRTARGG